MKLTVLVINCGSSSAKYDLFETESERSLARGLFDEIGSPKPVFTHRVNGGGEARVELPPDTGYEDCVRLIVEALCGRGEAGERTGGVIDSADAIDAVGHRVVHGGEKLTAPAIIDDEILAVIEENNELAPLHNPANLAGIQAAMRILPDVIQVAVMDTSFLATKPEAMRYYPIPFDWHEKYRIYRYGFHGNSHQYVSEEAARFLAKPLERTSLITCHLGNGCTIAAVRDGRACDISMCFTPLEGLMMGTRCGSIDSAIVPFLVQEKGLSLAEVFNALQKKSGLLGISGRSNDMRQLVEAADGGDGRCRLAIEMFANRCKLWIGGLLAEMGAPADAVVFTGGIGQFARSVRGRICQGLGHLGIRLDASANDAATGRGVECVSTPDSPVRILVIATNEELVIARHAARLAAGTLPEAGSNERDR